MEIDIKLCPNEICRTCLCKSNNMRSLTSVIEGEHRTLFDVLMFVANLNIKTSDKLPKQVCIECEEILCKADAFKRRCLDSETYLNLHINKDADNDFGFEFSEKPIIKEPKTNKVSSKKTNNCKVKAPKGEGEVFDIIAPSTKDEKFLTPMTSKSENDSAVNCGINIVKQEISNEFESDIDFDFPLDFKQENNINEMKVFSCSCGSIYNQEEEYKTHLKTKNCNGYKKSMKIKMERKNSNGGRNITIKRQIICPECNLEFNTIKACKLHQKQHSTDDEHGSFECTLCMRKFSRKSSYTTHINHHDVKAKVKYTCDACKREFQHKAHLDNHVISVHSREKGFTCECCAMNFSTQESLEIHKESHKTEKKHQCKICQKAFYMLSTLKDHMRTHTGERPFLCSICGRGFSQKTNLAQHMRRHQGLKPYKCKDCDRGFVSKGELVAHTRKHSGAHPFVCDECGSGFTTSSSLIKHRRIHTGERPYACDLCPMKFAASGTLKNHRRTHTGEKPFQCSYCEKAFVQRQDLVSHIRCHTGERPFGCGCGQAFRKASSLKAHVKTHAREPMHGLLDGVAQHGMQSDYVKLGAGENP